MKKLMLLSVAVLALASVGIAASVATAGGNGAVVTNVATNPIPGLTGFDFDFWNGNGVVQDFAPTYFQEVLAPSGVHNEVLKGTASNDSGHAVVYTADSGSPIPAGQTCWDFNGPGNFTTDWQMTISASGNYTLTCHFGA